MTCNPYYSLPAYTYPRPSGEIFSSLLLDPQVFVSGTLNPGESEALSYSANNVRTCFWPAKGFMLSLLKFVGR